MFWDEQDGTLNVAETNGGHIFRLDPASGEVLEEWRIDGPEVHGLTRSADGRICGLATPPPTTSWPSSAEAAPPHQLTDAATSRPGREAFNMAWEVLWPLILGFASGAVQAVVSHKAMSRLRGDVALAGDDVQGAEDHLDDVHHGAQRRIPRLRRGDALALRAHGAMLRMMA